MERPVTITANAVKKIKEMRQAEGNNDLAFRVKLQGGMCAGFTYKFEFSTPEPNIDIIYNVDDDLKVCIDKKSALFLSGTELDWEKNLLHSGFKINNPNAKTGCGCGKSFGV